MLPFDAAWDALKKSAFRTRSYQMSLPTEEDPKGVPLSSAVQGKSVVDTHFERGLEERMKPSKRPTKIENLQYRSDEPTGYGEFLLTDDEGNIYSKLEGNVDRRYPGQADLRDIIGHTNNPYQGRGYYRALMNAALQSGYRVRSDDRNQNSQGFHEKFQQNLPPGVVFDVERNKLVSSTPQWDAYTYGIPQREFQRREEATNRQGWGDLQPDYTTFPVETMFPDLDEVESRKANDLNQRFGSMFVPELGGLRPVGQTGLERFGVDVPSVPMPTPFPPAPVTAQDYVNMQELFG